MNFYIQISLQIKNVDPLFVNVPQKIPQATINGSLVFDMNYNYRLKRSKIRVILGDHDQSTTTDVPAKMRAVSAIIRHRNFDTDTYNHDIALLKLRKPVEFTKSIRPICLPSSK